MAGRRSLLDEIVRDGGRQMLAAALRAEVAAYVEQFADQLDADGCRVVVGNGYHREREVLTAAGVVTVSAPWVNDKRVDTDTGERQRCSSATLMLVRVVRPYGGRPGFVLLGGLVPAPLCANSPWRGVGTTDVDVQVNFEIAGGRPAPNASKSPYATLNSYLTTRMSGAGT